MHVVRVCCARMRELHTWYAFSTSPDTTNPLASGGVNAAAGGTSRLTCCAPPAFLFPPPATALPPPPPPPPTAIFRGALPPLPLANEEGRAAVVGAETLFIEAVESVALCPSHKSPSHALPLLHRSSKRRTSS